MFDDSGLNMNKLTLSLATELPVGKLRTLYSIPVFHQVLIQTKPSNNEKKTNIFTILNIKKRNKNETKKRQ